MSEGARRAGSYGREAADPLLDGLSADAAELAKRWAVALIDGADPEEIAALDLGLIAREGPSLVEALLSACGPHAEAPGAGADVVALAGAGSGAELVRAVELLRAVLWEAAVQASPRARSEPRPARRLLDFGDRLAGACAELLAGELARLEAPPRPGEAEPPPASRAGGGQTGGAGGTPARGEALPIVIVDERHPGAEQPPAAAPAGRAAPEPPIAARDARAEQGPAAWIGAIGAQLAQFERDRRPFAVLLIELLEPAPSGGASPLERAVQERGREWGALTLTRERPGRWWLLAPGADRVAAVSLRERLEQALGAGAGGVGSAAVLGAVAIGIAVCPEDALDAPGLAAQADLDIYAARSHPITGHPPSRGAGRQAHAPGERGGGFRL